MASRTSTRPRAKLSRDQLEHMVEEATVDALWSSVRPIRSTTTSRIKQGGTEWKFQIVLKHREKPADLLGFPILLRYAVAAKSGREYAFWICHCLSRRPKDGNGSRPTGTGQGGHGRFP